MESLDQYDDKLGSPMLSSISMLRTIDSKSSLGDLSVHDIDRLIERSLHGLGTNDK